MGVVSVLPGAPGESPVPQMRRNQKVYRPLWARESYSFLPLASSIYNKKREDPCQQFRINLLQAGHHPSGGGDGNLS